MSGVSTRGRLLRGVAVTGALGMLATTLATGGAQAADVNPAAQVPGPDLEFTWESGTSGHVYDGDTIDVAIRSTNSGRTGTYRVRTVGVNSPEVKHSGQREQCGAAQAKSRMGAIVPSGTSVQLRARKGTSFDNTRGRLVRSIYAQDDEGNWYDTARQLVSDGRVVWFPLDADSGEKPEYSHNLEYRVLAEDAELAGRGLWKANLCGTSPEAKLRVVASWDQSVDGEERVYIINDNPGAAVNLGGWAIRDTALNIWWLPSGAYVPAGGSIEIRFAKGTHNPAAGIYYTGKDNWFGNLPIDNSSFTGDAVYLMDAAGPYETGNLRAWGPYPCDPDNCVAGLSGKLSVVQPKDADWATGQDTPSAPWGVSVSTAADGSGGVTVSWKAPTYTGGSALTEFQVSGTQVGGSALKTRTVGTSTTSTTWTGLTPGKQYTFQVTTRNALGSSPASPATAAVTSRARPEAPQSVVGRPGDGSVTASWKAPAADNGSAVLGYFVTARTADGTAAGTCEPIGAATSCVVTGLQNGSAYRVEAIARNAVGESGGASSEPVSPAAWTPGPAPATAAQAVTATPAPGSAVVSWDPPASDGGAQISAYTVTAVQAPNRTCTTAGDIAGGPALSCTVTGLTNGSAHTFTVRATGGPVAGPISAPSAGVIPKAEDRVATVTGGANPDPSTWSARMSLGVRNDSGATVDLTGYALWGKVPSNAKPTSTNRPLFVFPRGTKIGAGDTLTVRSGAPTYREPAKAGALVYTGKAVAFTRPSSGGDRIQLSALDLAPVACIAWGSVTCQGQRPISLPTQPVGITARATGTSVIAQWGQPISRGGTAITGYTATAWTSPTGGTAMGTCSTNGAGRNCAIPGRIGRTYYVDVVAKNAVGSSTPSAPRVQAVPRTAPSAPAGVALSAVQGGFLVRWAPATPNGAPIQRYTASAYLSGTGGKPIGSCTTSSGTATQCTITGLPSGRYYVGVTATNRAGTGAANSPRVGGTPGAGKAVTTYSGKRVHVRWDAPPAAAGVTGYVARVYTKAAGGKLLATCTAKAGALSCTTTKLKKRTKFYVALTMTTASGSFTVTPRIVTGPAKAASVPTLTGAVPSARKVVVSWKAPSFNGYSALKSYGARLYSKSKGGSAKGSCSASSTGVRCTTKSMKKGTYYASVRVKNSHGWSKWAKRVKVSVR